MFSLNWYTNVLLYFRNRCDFLRHWEKPLWNLCWRKSLKTFGSICFGHIYFLNPKIIFWSIIWRLHKTKWHNWKWLLGIHEKNPSNNLFKTFLALVSSSSFHWHYAHLSTFKMDHKTIKENSFRPCNRLWDYSPLTSYFSRLGCHQFLSGNHRLVRRKIPPSINRCPWMCNVLVLLFLTFDQQTRWIRLLLRYFD